MVLNGTIIAQMLHFALAYIVLKWWLFEPTIALVKNEDALTQSMYKQIEECHERIVHIKQARLQAWHVYQHFYGVHCPDGFQEKQCVDVKSKNFFTEEIGESFFSEDNMVKKIAKKLCDRVLHDYI